MMRGRLSVTLLALTLAPPVSPLALAGRPRPAYLEADWWNPGSDWHPSEPDAPIYTPPAGPELADPCFWDDGCEARAEMDDAPAFVTDLAPTLAEQLASADFPIPCVNTEEGCALEEAAGLLEDLAELDAAAASQPGPGMVSAPWEDSCWHDQGCDTF